MTAELFSFNEYKSKNLLNQNRNVQLPSDKLSTTVSTTSSTTNTTTADAASNIMMMMIVMIRAELKFECFAILCQEFRDCSQTDRSLLTWRY